ncbi:MAG: hypothetical protein IJH39_11480 [Clostridia bacterium]|nr:hypothetical protein [Clostridia bacterium]
MTKNEITSVANFMLEGRTYAEAAKEWGVSSGCIQRNINENFRYMDSKKYQLLKNRPYMAFQRVVYTSCSLEEALKVWQVSKKRFDEFMCSIFSQDKKSYLKMRGTLEAAKCKNKMCAL